MLICLKEGRKTAPLSLYFFRGANVPSDPLWIRHCMFLQSKIEINIRCRLLAENYPELLFPVGSGIYSS